MLPNGLLQGFDGLRGAASQTLLGHVARHAFHGIEPRATGGGGVDMESRMRGQPFAHLLVFVGRVIIHDEVNLLVGRAAFFNPAQEKDHSW